MLRPVVTIKVFFDKFFDETLIVTTVKEIFDKKNFDQLWWNRTPSYFSSNFDGFWWKSTNQNTVLEWWDDVYKTKTHGNKKAGKGKSVARKRNVTASRSAADMASRKFGILSLYQWSHFLKEHLECCFVHSKIISELVRVFSVQFFSATKI